MNKLYYIAHPNRRPAKESGRPFRTTNKQEAQFLAWSMNLDLIKEKHVQVKEFGHQPYLDVPYKSQWGPTANIRRGDCGPACNAMIVPFRTTRNPTVDQAADACGQPATGTGSYYTNHGQLIRGAAAFDVTLETRSKYRPPELTLELLEAQVDAGLPSIALIHYGVLRDETNKLMASMGYVKNQDQNYDRGHWVVFIGYDKADVIIHDPDFYGSREQDGNARRMPRYSFEKALEAVAPGCTVGFQGLIVG